MSSETSTSPNAPGFTEFQIIQQQLELAELQIDQLKTQRKQQERFTRKLDRDFDRQKKEAKRGKKQARRAGQRQRKFENILLEELKTAGEASPEQIAQIEEAADAALARGETDIDRFEEEAFDRLGEFAQARGLRPGDSPILDRGGEISAEGVRQRGALSESLRGASAEARLNLPLAQQQITGSQAIAQQGISEAARQFSEQLRANAFSNRLGIADVSSGLGARLLGNPAQTLASARAPFTGGLTRTDTPGFGANLVSAGRLAAGVGGLFTGIGAF